MRGFGKGSHGQPSLRHVSQTDSAGDKCDSLHCRVLQYGADEAAFLLGDMLGETRPYGATSQGCLRRRIEA